jgi:hypothetical protein
MVTNISGRRTPVPRGRTGSVRVVMHLSTARCEKLFPVLSTFEVHVHQVRILGIAALLEDVGAAAVVADFAGNWLVNDQSEARTGPAFARDVGFFDDRHRKRTRCLPETVAVRYN